MSDKAKPGQSGAVRALARGLSVLRHINRMGEARPGEIARALDLPRPTVYRLLETLEELGYVAFSASSNRVRVTPLAASLGDNSSRSSALCQAAGPVFARYADRLVWPLDLCTYENAAMVVRETTHGRSPLSIDRAMVGFRLPMLRTAPGRAYLAFCGEEERGLILDHLRRLCDPADAPFLEPRALMRLLGDTQARGVALRDTGEFRSQTASIAAPVMDPGGQGVIGCVSMIWIRSAMTSSKALESAGLLKTLADEIAQAMAGAAPAA